MEVDYMARDEAQTAPRGDTLDAAATHTREAVERLAAHLDELAERLRPLLADQDPEARVGIVRCASPDAAPLTAYMVETVQQIEGLQSVVRGLCSRVNLA